MENATRFDLNDAVRQWRAQLESSPAFRGADLDELGAHLLDSTRSLQDRGLSAQEAFWVARSRLGSTDLLAGEFEKVNPGRVWLNRVLWMVVGAVGIGLLSGLGEVLTNLLTLGLHALLPNHVAATGSRSLGWFSLAASLALFCGLLAWAYRSGKANEAFLSRVGRWSRTHPLLAAAAVLAGNMLIQAVRLVCIFCLARTLGAERFAELSMPRAYGSLVLLLAWPAILAWLLVRTSGRAATR